MSESERKPGLYFVREPTPEKRVRLWHNYPHGAGWIQMGDNRLCDEPFGDIIAGPYTTEELLLRVKK